MQFPYYLALGMTYDMFWKDDPSIVVYYQKYAEIRREQRNNDAWWFGAYVYAALVRSSGAFNFFGKSRHPDDYLERPIAPDQKTEEEKKEENQKKIEAGVQAFVAMASRVNKRLKRGEKNA